MDSKTLQSCICSKCFCCFDQYAFTIWAHSWVAIPNDNSKRYYCNYHHKYVDPDSMEMCFQTPTTCIVQKQL